IKNKENPVKDSPCFPRLLYYHCISVHGPIRFFKTRKAVFYFSPDRIIDFYHFSVFIIAGQNDTVGSGRPVKGNTIFSSCPEPCRTSHIEGSPHNNRHSLVNILKQSFKR